MEIAVGGRSLRRFDCPLVSRENRAEPKQQRNLLPRSVLEGADRPICRIPSAPGTLLFLGQSGTLPRSHCAPSMLLLQVSNGIFVPRVCFSNGKKEKKKMKCLLLEKSQGSNGRVPWTRPVPSRPVHTCYISIERVHLKHAAPLVGDERARNYADVRAWVVRLCRSPIDVVSFIRKRRIDSISFPEQIGPFRFFTSIAPYTLRNGANDRIGS